MSNSLITITGPSGSGKTELLNVLVQRAKFAKLVSVTTRPPRVGEVDGIDYVFKSKSWFTAERDSGNFAQTVQFAGNYYGTHNIQVSECSKKQLTPAVIVEPGGVTQFRAFCAERDLQLISIFVNADTEVLISRYLSRMKNTDITDPIKRKYHANRIRGIISEVAEWPSLQEYDVRLTNSGDDITYITRLAEAVESLV